MIEILCNNYPKQKYQIIKKIDPNYTTIPKKIRHVLDEMIFKDLLMRFKEIALLHPNHTKKLKEWYLESFKKKT